MRPYLRWDDYCREHPLPRYQVVGLVTSVRPYGVQLGCGQWYHASRFVDPQPTLPAVGERVTLHLNHRGYVESIGPWQDLRPLAEQFAERIARCTTEEERLAVRDELRARAREFPTVQQYEGLLMAVGARKRELAKAAS